MTMRSSNDHRAPRSQEPHMVISYDKKFLFLHVPKTGGLSMTEVLQGYQHDPDQYVANRLLARIGIGVNHFLFSYRQRKFRRHSTAWHVRRRLPPPIFNGLFKFAFIRNPWDLLVSYHKFVMARPKHHRHARIKKLRFHDYIRFAAAKKVGFQKAFLSDPRAICWSTMSAASSECRTISLRFWATLGSTRSYLT